MAPVDQELLAAVERSPQAAGAHDRAAWVELFTTDGRVYDPVGSAPHVGHTQIGRFYDTFIAPRDITFRRDLDVVRGHAVIRDLEICAVMGAVTMAIPAFLRYDLCDVDGVWKIRELRAYWDMPAMVLQFVRNGAAALPPGLQLSYRLLRNQRLTGTAGFAAGFRRGGSRPKRSLAAFLSAAARGNQRAAAGLLPAGATVTIGDDEPVDIAEVVDRLKGAGWTKMIAAGPTIAVALSAARGRGVLFADLTGCGRRIGGIRFFST